MVKFNPVIVKKITMDIGISKHPSVTEKPTPRLESNTEKRGELGLLKYHSNQFHKGRGFNPEKTDFGYLSIEDLFSLNVPTQDDEFLLDSEDHTGQPNQDLT